MSAALLAHYREMARYNSGANRRLYAACAELPDAARKRDLGAFFGSIHGTLNHILLGDRIWLARFAGRTVPSTGLDAILYESFAELRAAREIEDVRLEAFADGLDAAALDGTIRYVNNQGLDIADPVPLVLAHLFNHQTHHRGQVHALLSRLEPETGVAPPSLDLHRVLHPSQVYST